MSTSHLAPGTHSFTAPAKKLVFEYVVHTCLSKTVPGEDPTSRLIVVLCPGWGLGSQYLQRGLSDLWNPSNATGHETSTTYSVLFFHPRGTGGSSRPENADQMRSMPDMASDLEDLRVYLELDRFDTLIGHSNGGAIVLGYAEMYPTRVERLVLLNHQVVGIQDRKIVDMEGTQHDPKYRGAWQSMLNRRTDTDEEFTESVNKMWPLYFFDPEMYTDELLNAIGDWKISAWCYHAQGGCDRKLENPMQMVHRMRDVRAATLILSGADDMICGRRIAERTMQGIPNASMIELGECGHFPWIEQKEKTMHHIRQFIEGAMD